MVNQKFKKISLSHLALKITLATENEEQLNQCSNVKISQNYRHTGSNIIESKSRKIHHHWAPAINFL